MTVTGRAGPADMSGQDKYSETAFWDRVAAQRVYAAFDREEYEEVFDRMFGADLSGKTVIDIGSASGVSAAILASRGARVIGIDISPDLIAQARELWRDYGERIDFMVGDAENLTIEDGSVDFCFFGGVLHHFPDRSRVYAEALRVLVPGGVFVAIEPNLLDVFERIEWSVARWRGKLTPNEEPIDPVAMQRELEQAGFTDARFVTTRHDIPVLAQFPILKKFFNRRRGFAVKRPVLGLVNALRPSVSRGTFFVIQASRAGGAAT